MVLDTACLEAMKVWAEIKDFFVSELSIGKEYSCAVKYRVFPIRDFI